MHLRVLHFTPGTYAGISQCSLNSGAVAATFNIPIALTIMNDGITYSVSESGFAGTFYLGAPGTLTLTLTGGTTGQKPILFVSHELVGDGNLLLTPTPATTPLPPSIILTLTGLAGAVLLAARRKCYFI
jgi:hypothetical protein